MADKINKSSSPSTTGKPGGQSNRGSNVPTPTTMHSMP